MTAAARAKPDDIASWLWTLSWTLWIAVFAGCVGLGLHMLAAHKHELRLGRATGHVQFQICKRFAKLPRPTWQECLSRSADPGSDLLAPATPGFEMD